MKQTLGLFLLFFFFCEIFTVNAHCVSQWDSFLQQINNDTFKVLEDALSECEQHCNHEVVPTQNQRAQLFELIRKGNELAYRAALLVSICWDGGEIEDFYRSAGVYFEHRPDSFLKIAISQDLSDSQLKLSLTMLPLDTIDDIDHKIKVIDDRISILESINEKSLNTISKESLTFLNVEKKKLESIRIDLKQ